ncbi:M20/M25/M40 family metallo-hydrolase [Pseudonocardiaceae bacterium YIM PH 21723]|nr:M20/M25/M40 family metallo-hydrolase [Pseudonocardiaceae bacterium YIM PH 21723]
MTLAAALGYAATHRRRFLADVAALAAIPSVSADPRHAGDVARAARWLVARLSRAGLGDARLVPTDGHPLVVTGSGDPDVLVYGHYDVQPAGPLRDWHSPPFRPTRRGDLLIGRGTSDDKGQLLAHVCAAESWLRGTGRLPVNVRYVFDGSEEIGSAVSMPFFSALRPGLVVISDTAMATPSVPAVTVSLRGTVKLQVTASGAPYDLHAGTYGGRVVQAAVELSRLLALLADRFPGMVITALRAGSGGGVIPARASAALDIRFGRGLSPSSVVRSVRRFLLAESRVRIAVRCVAGAPAVSVSGGVSAAVQACRVGFGRSPSFVRSGGTIPVVGEFARRGIPVLLLGFALPDNRMHGPDERLSVSAFQRGVRTSVALLHFLGQGRPRGGLLRSESVRCPPAMP